MWLSESYALIICIINFLFFFLFFFSSKDTICYCRKQYKSYLQSYLWLPGMHLVYSCTEVYWAEEILNACTLLYILVYLGCGVYCATLFAVVVNLSPSQGDSSLTLLTFFQLINKLTDLPYAKSHVSPESTCLTRRSNAADVTLTDYSPCKGTSAINNVTTSWCHKVQFRIRCWCVRFPDPMSSYQILVSNTYLIFHCRWCHTFNKCKCFTMVTS